MGEKAYQIMYKMAFDDAAFGGAKAAMRRNVVNNNFAPRPQAAEI